MLDARSHLVDGGGELVDLGGERLERVVEIVDREVGGGDRRLQSYGALLLLGLVVGESPPARGSVW